MNKDEIYKKGQQWDEQIHFGIVKQRNIFIGSTLLMGLVTLALIVLLVSLFPLKSIKGYAIVVDKTTGHVEVMNTVKQTLEKDALEAVKINLLTQFIIWYKTYDESDSIQRSEKIMMFSNRKVFNEYRDLFNLENNKNPNIYYKEGEKAEVEIINVIYLNENTYQIRFELNENLRNKSYLVTRKFTSTIKFNLSNGKMTNTQMWKNPIGLIIESIRFDEEYQTTRG